MRRLKTIGVMAGIADTVSEAEKKAPKFNFITTHTAKRSAATNFYLQGVSTKLIADLGGWKSIPVLQTYLRASGLESAELAKKLEFFKENNSFGTE